MSKKIKCAAITLALASVFALSTAFSACTVKTDHPTAKITISFNNETYEINYKLYRNMYPQTVQHFIELADNGFYKDMIVHDYKDGGDWFTGAYSYEQSAYTADSEYLEDHYKEEEYYTYFNENKLTASVYSKISYDKNGKETVSDEDALATLIGEFSENGHTIEKNALSAKYGSLKMFYYEEGTDNEKVAVNNWANQNLMRDYKYNCATSVFSMQVGTSSAYGSSKYCVFAELKDDKSRDALDDLIDAIKDEQDNVGSNFTASGIKTSVNSHDYFSEYRNMEVTFTMLKTQPIIIKSVTITKH